MKTKAKYITLPIGFILLVLVAGIAGCTKDEGVGRPGPNEVWMQNTAYTPISLTVPVNTTVKWINKDDMEHTVTSDSGLFDSDVIGINGTFSRTFDSVGQFPYHCDIHSNMTGTVVVQ